LKTNVHSTEIDQICTRTFYAFVICEKNDYIGRLVKLASLLSYWKKCNL